MRLKAAQVMSVLAGISALATLPACGGDDDSPSDAPPPAPATEKIGDERYVERANAICLDARREKRKLGDTVSASGSTPLETTTEEIVAPGIEVLERESARLRAIEPRPDHSSLETFLGLFDPILVLADRRLQAGRAGDPTGAGTVEGSVSDLERAQRLAAEAAGLDECGLGFAAALSGAKP